MPPAPPPASSTPDLISMARRTRQHAEAYRDIVSRYCAEMPDYLDRFHQAMLDFHITAARLRGQTQGSRITPAETPLQQPPA